MVRTHSQILIESMVGLVVMMSIVNPQSSTIGLTSGNATSLEQATIIVSLGQLMIGSHVSQSTSTVKLQIAAFPDWSKAAKETSDRPQENSSPEIKPSDSVLIKTSPQLSIAIGSLQVAMVVNSFKAAVTVMSSGHRVKTGKTSSTTVTANEQVASLPQSSVAR